MKKQYTKPEVEYINTYKDKDSFVMSASLEDVFNNNELKLDDDFSLTDAIFNNWKNI